ncbi:MAG: hypothetical protein R3F02_15010 [Thiolinea sp.]
MFKLLLKSLKAGSHSGNSLFSPGKSDVSDECVTADNTITRLYEQGTWKKRTGYILGLWLVWGAVSAAGVEQNPRCFSITYDRPDDPPYFWIPFYCDKIHLGYSDPVCRIKVYLNKLEPNFDRPAYSWHPDKVENIEVEAPYEANIDVHCDLAQYGFSSACYPPPYRGGWRKLTQLEYLRAREQMDIRFRDSNKPWYVGESENSGTKEYFMGISATSVSQVRLALKDGLKTIGCAYEINASNSYVYSADKYNMYVAASAAGGLYATYSGAPIEHGASVAQVENGTLFSGVYGTEDELKHTFTLENFGAQRNMTITISSFDGDAYTKVNTVAGSANYQVLENGVGESDFAVSPVTLTIPEGTYGAPGQAIFDISFKPGGKGLRQAVVNIDQDDENEIRFLIQGGLASPIQLRGYSYAIGDMDDTPTHTDATDFLSQKINADPITHTFTLLNKETRDITVIAELRDATTGFSLGEQSVVVLAATDEGVGSAAFDITFDPATTGLHETFVDLSYDGERQLSFKISGEGESSGGGGAVSPMGLGLLGLLLAGLGYRRYRLSNQAS